MGRGTPIGTTCKRYLSQRFSGTSSKRNDSTLCLSESECSPHCSRVAIDYNALKFIALGFPFFGSILVSNETF